MRITIYSFGRAKHQFLVEGEGEYLKRLAPEAKVQLRELEAAGGSSAPPEAIRREEARTLLSKVKDGEYLIALDERGRALSSPEFAELLKKNFDRGISDISFAVGGPEGWDKSVLQRADTALSLSAMTFTSQLARFILIEQLYRALRIVKGRPYHR